MLAAILEAVFELLARVSLVYSVVTAIRNIIFGDALNKDLVTAEERIAVGYSLWTDTSVGFYALKAAIDALTPVTLPTSPPPGYGVDEDSIAAAVWGYSSPFVHSYPASYMFSSMFEFASRSSGATLLPSNSNPLFLVSGWRSALDGPEYENPWPTVNLTSVLADDTVTSWLEREEPLWTWIPWNDGGYVGATDYTHNNGPTAVCRFNDADFEQVKRDLNLLPSFNAPVYPGVSGITTGTPVAIADSVDVPGPLHGVIVVITGVPPKQGYFSFGSLISWRNVGAISFVSDTGSAEYAQTLGFSAGMYLPKTMVLAASAVVRTTGGVTGTLTPFTINSA